MDSTALVLETPPRSPSPIPCPTSEHYTFIPKLNAKIPRAWERKPSTPFAPRNESQRIWKRYEIRDTNLSGALQSKTKETRPVKKLRLGGQEIHAYITSWEDELQETRHKDSAQREQGAIIHQLLTNPNTTNHDATSPRLARTNDGHVRLIKTSQNVENQGKDNTQRLNEYRKSISVEMRDTIYQDLHLLKPEYGSTEASISHEPALEEQLDAGTEQDLTEQKLYEKAAEHGIAVTPQGVTLPAGEEATNVVNSGRSEQEEDLPSIWLTNGDSSGRIHTNPKQMTVGLGACQSNATPDEALQTTVTGNQPQLTSIRRQTPFLQFQTALEGLEAKPPSGFALQIEDTEHQHEPIVLPQSGTECNTAKHEDPLQQLQVGNAIPASIKEQQLIRHEMESTEDGGKENARPGSPARQDLPTQVQEPPSKAPAIVQDDDTDYLHAFLTRAKAKKAAREGSPRKVDRVPPSPMTRSRAALLPLSTNSPSPKKANKHRQDTTYEADVAETNKAGSPCRRSGRIRVPQPQKAPIVTTSTIPVRRSNGTEFIFLQNTETAQIALATRTNTKRNKGEAVLPKMKLQALAQVQKSPSKSPKPRRGKGVSWKDEPTYFGMRDDAAEEAGEERKADIKPSARKVRRLGAVNGTPAPKKMMAEDATGMRTTAPRTRGKAKG